MLSGWTPAKTLELMLSQKRLSARLAIAIAHLEENWSDLPYGVQLARSRDGALALKRKTLRAALQNEDLSSTPLRFDKINGRSEDWLRALREPDLLDLLAYVVEVDRALQPDLAVPNRLKILRSHHTLPAELGKEIWIFEGPPSLSSELREVLEERQQKAAKKRLTPLPLYTPRLADWLTCVRYSRDRIEWTETPPYLQARIDEIWGEDSPKADGLEIRIGLFSLRGRFAAGFHYTRILAEKKHGFRAQGIQPPDEYMDRLDRVIDEASDPDRGVHILLLPELLMDTAGQERLSERLAELASRNDRRPPLLTVAGSFHVRNEERWANLCTVLDNTGRVLWRQQKRIPFPYQGKVPPWLQDYPDGLGPDESYHEDIEPGRSTVLAHFPLGWLAVAICADLVPATTGGSAYMARMPADWILVPSMSSATEQFLEAARDLARAGKFVCFANVDPRAKPQDAATSPPRPPRFLDETLWRSDLAAFLQTPVTRAFGLWYDAPEPPNGTMPGSARIAIPENGSWEGLVVDLMGVVDAYLTR